MGVFTLQMASGPIGYIMQSSLKVGTTENNAAVLKYVTEFLASVWQLLHFRFGIFQFEAVFCSDYVYLVFNIVPIW